MDHRCLRTTLSLAFGMRSQMNPRPTDGAGPPATWKPGRPSATVSDESAGPARMLWNDSWNQFRRSHRATCAFRAYSRAIALIRGFWVRAPGAPPTLSCPYAIRCVHGGFPVWAGVGRGMGVASVHARCTGRPLAAVLRGWMAQGARRLAAVPGVRRHCAGGGRAICQAGCAGLSPTGARVRACRRGERDAARRCRWVPGIMPPAAMMSAACPRRPGGPPRAAPKMAQSDNRTLPIPSPHRGGSRGPVRLLAIGQPPGLPALPDQGPLLRVPPRGGRHPSSGRIMHPAGASAGRPRSAGMCRWASQPIRHLC